MSIGEVARRAGLRTSAIRYYESAGLLEAPPRAGGQRRYGEGVLDQLRLIALAQRAGFTVAEIRTLMHGFARRTPASARWQALAQRKLGEVETQIADARTMQRVLETLLHCECPSLTDCARAMKEPDAVCAPPRARRRAPAAKTPRRR